MPPKKRRAAGGKDPAKKKAKNDIQKKKKSSAAESIQAHLLSMSAPGVEAALYSVAQLCDKSKMVATMRELAEKGELETALQQGDARGRTAVMNAAGCHWRKEDREVAVADVIGLCLAAGADAWAADNQGYTALFRLITDGPDSAQAAGLLLARSPQPQEHIQVAEGLSDSLTCMQLAHGRGRRGKPEILELLEQCMACPKQGWDVLAPYVAELSRLQAEKSWLTASPSSSPAAAPTAAAAAAAPQLELDLDDDDEAAQFNKELAKFWAPKKIIKQMNKNELDWHGLWMAVIAAGGYDAVVSAGHGLDGWKGVLKEGCPQCYSEKQARGIRVHKYYDLILKPFDEQQQEDERFNNLSKLRKQDVPDSPISNSSIDLSENGDDETTGELSSVSNDCKLIVHKMVKAIDEYKSDTRGLASNTGSISFVDRKGSADFMLIESLQEMLQEVAGNQLQDESRIKKKISFFGPNRIGKSTLIDLLLQIGERPASIYLKDTAAGRSLEAIEDILDVDKDLDDDDLSEIRVSNDDHFDSFSKLNLDFIPPGRKDQRPYSQICDRDKQGLDVYKQFCQGTVKLEETPLTPFLMPHGHEGGSLTNRGIRIRYGHRYHLAVEYKSYEEICEEILSVKWDAFVAAQEGDGDALTPEEQTYIDQRKALQRALRGDPKGGGQPAAEYDPDAEEEEDSSDASAELPEPTVPHKHEDIEICQAIKELLGKRQIFEGQGKTICHDRIYVQQQLLEVLCILEGERADHIQTFCALQEVILYVPNELLREGDVEWIDTPGAGDSDPLKRLETIEHLEEADVVLCVLPHKDLTSESDTQVMLREHVIERWKNPKKQNCLLRFIHLDEKEHKSAAVYTCSDAWSKNWARTLDNAAQGTKRAFQTDVRNVLGPGKDAELRSKAMIEATETYCVRPLLYCSLILNPTPVPLQMAGSVSVVDLGGQTEAALTDEVYTKALFRSKGSDLLSMVFDAGLGDAKARLERIKNKIEEADIQKNLEKFLPLEAGITQADQTLAEKWAKKTIGDTHPLYAAVQAMEANTKELMKFTADESDDDDDDDDDDITAAAAHLDLDPGLSKWVSALNDQLAPGLGPAMGGLLAQIQQGTKQQAFVRAFELSLDGAASCLPLRRLKTAAMKCVEDVTVNGKTLQQLANVHIDKFVAAICDQFQMQLKILLPSAGDSKTHNLIDLYTSERFEPKIRDAVKPIVKELDKAVRELRLKAIKPAFTTTILALDDGTFTKREWKEKLSKMLQVSVETFAECMPEASGTHIDGLFYKAVFKVKNKIAPTKGQGIMTKAFQAFLRSIAKQARNQEAAGNQAALTALAEHLKSAALDCKTVLETLQQYSDRKSKLAQNSVSTMRLMVQLNEGGTATATAIQQKRKIGSFPPWKNTFTEDAPKSGEAADLHMHFRSMQSIDGGERNLDNEVFRKTVDDCLGENCGLAEKFPDHLTGEGKPGVARASLYHSLINACSPPQKKGLPPHEVLNQISELHKCILRSLLDSTSSGLAQKDFKSKYCQDGDTDKDFFAYVTRHKMGKGLGDVPILVQFCNLFNCAVHVYVMDNSSCAGASSAAAAAAAGPSGRIKKYMVHPHDWNAQRKSRTEAYHVLLCDDGKTWAPLKRKELDVFHRGADLRTKMRQGWKLAESKSQARGQYYWHHPNVPGKTMWASGRERAEYDTLKQGEASAAKQQHLLSQAAQERDHGRFGRPGSPTQRPKPRTLHIPAMIKPPWRAKGTTEPSVLRLPQTAAGRGRGRGSARGGRGRGPGESTHASDPEPEGGAAGAGATVGGGGGGGASGGQTRKRSDGNDAAIVKQVKRHKK